MSLAERLARASGSENKLGDVRERVQARLIDALGPKLYDPNVSDEDVEYLVNQRLRELLADETSLSGPERAEVSRTIADMVLGLGPIEEFLKDADITEVMVNGCDHVYVEKNGKLQRTPVKFVNEEQLRRTIDKIVSKVGRRVDESSPYVDARLPDGSRVNAVIPPLSVDGPALTIRRFAHDPYKTADLVEFGTITEEVAQFLKACVDGRTNIIVAGGTGAGKTTTLNVLSSFIPEFERIVTIEDAAELQLQQTHKVRLEARPPNIEGKGAVTIRDLVRNSLRMRPDRIIVGECRGGEAIDMLQAMNTGHDGSISTVHANTPRDVLSRLETMCLMAGVELTMRAIREQIASAIDLIVHQERMKDGSRRITHITEVVGMEGDIITLQDIFMFNYKAGQDSTGKLLGKLEPTGLRPTFLETLADRGVHVPPQLFAPSDAGFAMGGRL